MKKYGKYKTPDGYLDFLAWKKSEIFRELSELGYDPYDFIEKFQTSYVGKLWDNQKLSNYIGQSAYAVALTFVADLESHGISLQKVSKESTVLPRFIPDIAAWIGMIYEMWARYAGLSGHEVYQMLGVYDLYCAWYDIGGNEPFSTVKEIADDPQRFKTD